MGGLRRAWAVAFVTATSVSAGHATAAPELFSRTESIGGAASESGADVSRHDALRSHFVTLKRQAEPTSAIGSFTRAKLNRQQLFDWPELSLTIGKDAIVAKRKHYVEKGGYASWVGAMMTSTSESSGLESSGNVIAGWRLDAAGAPLTQASGFTLTALMPISPDDFSPLENLGGGVSHHAYEGRECEATDELDESSHDFDVCLFEVFRPDLDEPEHSARIPPPKDAAADGVSELGKKVTGVPFDVTAGVSADALYGTGFAHELTTSSQLDVEVAYLAATGGNTALYGAQGITDYGDGTVSTFSGLRLDNGNTIDLVMLYSNGALNYYSGNHDSAKSAIASGVALGNAVLQASNVPLTMNLVYTGYVSYTDTSYSDALTALTYGAVPNASYLRDLYKADMVQMVINPSSGPVYCGLSYIADYSFNPSYGTWMESLAYGVVNPACFSYYSALHELAHPLGCFHDLDTSGTQPGPSYQYGWRYCDNTGFRTVMSYSCPNDPYIARLGYLSNPDVSYAGRPTGDASRANNARVLRENRFYVANFRSSQSSASAPAPSPVCGNGIVEGSEECDDGNTSSGDGCADDCTVEFCGDGVLQAGLGEDCDDGNTRNGDGCSSSCMVEVSGPSPTPPVSTPAATPSPSPTPEAAGGSSSWGGTFAVHMGCFLDDPAERALYGSFKDFKDALTPEECSQHCDDEGWSIAGMQAGSECYCGTGAYVTHGEGTCDSKCTGDSSTLCGGKSSNSVYAVATGCAPSNLGCYNRELNQLLTGKSTSDPSMTVELCDDFCEGYDLFMVSQGTDCYCGNDAFGSPGPSSECNQACGGDKNQVCGGANAVSIFTVSASRPAGQPLCS